MKNCENCGYLVERDSGVRYCNAPIPAWVNYKDSWVYPTNRYHIELWEIDPEQFIRCEMWKAAKQ